MHIAMAEFTAQQVQELVHRISGLERMNQQLQTQQTTSHNTVALLSQQLNRAQQGPSQGVARPRFSGKVGDFDDWHFKMKQFMESEAEFLPFMMWVDQQAAHVSEEEFAHYDQQEGLELNTVQDLHTDEVTPFIRENGVYLMDMWIPPAPTSAKPESDFQRLGQR